MDKSAKVCGSLSLRCYGRNADAVKNLISHRYKALAKLKSWLAGGELDP
jgi:inosine/xanthosine triphosphate pyrophosphatase family protein